MRYMAVTTIGFGTCLICQTAQAQLHTTRNAQPMLSVALANPVVDIDVNYGGTGVTLFAVSHAPEALDAIYAVALVGPHRSYALHRQNESHKQRFEFASVPTVLTVAAERAVVGFTTPERLISSDVHPRYSARPVEAHVDDPDLPKWQQALARIKQDQGLFSIDTMGIQRLDSGLLRADLSLPAAAPPGQYDVRLFLFSDDEIMAEAATDLVLRRQGAENTLWRMASDMPWLYGTLAVCLGVAMGGLGAALGRR